MKGTSMSGYMLRKQGNVWLLFLRHSAMYISEEVDSTLDNTPPSTGEPSSLHLFEEEKGGKRFPFKWGRLLLSRLGAGGLP